MDNLNGANWTGDELVGTTDPVFTNENGWMSSNGKLPVLKASDGRIVVKMTKRQTGSCFYWL